MIYSNSSTQALVGHYRSNVAYAREGMVHTRKLGGKRYVGMVRTSYNECHKLAKRFRRMGYSARVTKDPDSNRTYTLWVRKV